MSGENFISLPPKRAAGNLRRVGSRTSGDRGGNDEAMVRRIGVSKTITRRQSELVNSRRCELISRANLFPPPNACAVERSVVTGCVVKRARPLLKLLAAAESELRETFEP